MANDGAKNMLSNRRPRKVRGSGAKAISEKIPVLMAEGKTQKQAIGEAYGMQRSGRLRRHGVYVPKGKK